MASGDTLFEFLILSNQTSTANFATPDFFSGSTGIRLVLDFIGSGGSVDETAFFESYFPSHYDGGGVDVILDVSTDGTSTGAMQYEVSIESLQDGDDQDAGGATFGAATDILWASDSTTGVANTLVRTPAGAITHSNCGSPSVGDRMRIKIARDHDHAVNTDDGQLHGIYVTET